VTEKLGDETRHSERLATETGDQGLDRIDRMNRIGISHILI
jgi:hypothetical protein